MWCPAIVWTAVGGPVTLNGPFTFSGVSGSASPAFNIDGSSSSCTATSGSPITLAVNHSCVESVFYSGTSAGTAAATLTPPSGTSFSSTVSLSATVSAGSLTINGAGVQTFTCTYGSIGTPETCFSSATVQAVGGSVTLGNPVTIIPNGVGAYTTRSNANYWVNASVAPGTCTPGLVLTAGATCTLGAGTLTPINVAGANEALISLNTASGGGAWMEIFQNLTGNPAGAGIGAFTPTSVTCPSSTSGVAVNCGTVKIAANAAVTFSSSPYSFADGEFSVSLTGDTCAGNSFTEGTFCQTGQISFTPNSTTGLKISTLVLGLTSGSSNVSLNVSGTVTAPPGGVLTPNVSSISCPNALINKSIYCTSVTYTAVGGAVTFASTPFTSSNGAFSLNNASDCQGNSPVTLAAGQTCQALTQFNSAAVGSYTATITPALTAGTGIAYSISGTATAAGITVNPFVTSCANSTVGTALTCAGPTLTATGGSVTLGNPVFSAPNALSETPTSAFWLIGGSNISYSGGTCTPGLVLASGATCSVGNVTFTPAGTSTDQLYLSINSPAQGGTFFAFTTTVSGTNGGIGAYSANPLICPTTLVGSNSNCGTVTITANAALSFAATSTYSFGGATIYSISATGDTCIGKTLVIGQSCTTGAITYSPTTPGTNNATMTIARSDAGTNGSVSLTGSATVPGGTLSATTATIACGNDGVGLTATCATQTLTATGGSVTLGATPFSSSDTEFAIPLGTCTANLALASGATCTTGALTYTATSLGAKSATVTVSASSGTGTTFAATGTGVAGTAVITVGGTGSFNCGSAVAGLAGGSSSPCNSWAIVTATGGPITFTATPWTQTNSTDFSVFTSGTTCTANLALTAGSTCTIGSSANKNTFSPIAVGARSDVVSLNLSLGTTASYTLTGTGTVGTLTSSPTSITCGPTNSLAAVTCGSLTLTASGTVGISSAPYSFSDSEFTVSAGGTCSNASLTNNQTCTTGVISFAPTTNTPGTIPATLTIARSDSGANATISASGTVATGTAVLTAGSGTTCPNSTIGISVSCGTLTVTASGDAIKLGSTFGTLSGSGAAAYSLGASGTCTANQILTVGASCTVGPLNFNPTTSGTSPVTVTVTPASGNAGSIAFSGATWGFATFANPNTGTNTCASAMASHASSNCFYLTVTATGGAIQFGASSTFFTTSGSSAFSFVTAVGLQASGYCAANEILAANATCTLQLANANSIVFTPTVVGTVTTTVSTALAHGTNGSFTLSATGDPGTLLASPSTVVCPTANQVNSSTCGTTTLTATGIVTLSNPAFTSTNAAFSALSGTCANATLTDGQTCTTGTLTFAPVTNTAGGIFANLNANRSDSGPAFQMNINGSVGNMGTATLSPTSSLTCPQTNPGTPVSCGAITITATGGVLQLNSTVATLNNPIFTFAAGGTCTANQILTTGSTCTTGAVMFSPTGAGSTSSTVTVTPTTGATGSATFTATTFGTLIAATVPVSCPSTAVGLTSNCTTVTLTANGGPVTLGATPFTNGNATNFTLPLGTCTANKALASAGTCVTGTITFNPQTNGALTAAITVNTASGTNTSFNVNGTGTYGTVSINHTALACGSMTVGGTAINCGTITLTANGGPIRLGTTPLSLTDNTNFVVDAGTCTSGLLLAASGTCTTGQVVFNPTAAGVYTPTLTLNCSGTSCSPTVALSGTGFTYAYNLTTWLPATGSSCTLALAQTRTVTCQQYNGTSFATVANTNCTGATPASSQSVADSSSCGTVSAATLSCPTTNIGATSTCGSVTVTASGGPVSFGATVFTNGSDFTIPSGTCANATIGAGSTCTSGVASFTPTAFGSRNAGVTISPSAGLGTSGNFLASGAGAGTISVGSPPSCANTADGLAVTCGTVTLTAVGNTVIFGATPFSSNNADFALGSGTCANTTLSAGQTCTSGAVTFNPSIVGADAATVSITTLSGSPSSFNLSGIGHVYAWVSGAFTPAAGSACTATLAQTREVTCQNDVGTIVADTFCTATKPAVSQTVSDFGGCTFSWTQSGFGSCTGGDGSWTYSSWTPSTGCGTNLPQTRTGSCVVNANSGAEAQTVSCLRSDGTTVSDVSCASLGTKPASSQSCTPTTFSCGTEGAIAQTFNDVSTCTYAWNASGFSAPSSTCSVSATETQSVTCLQSDGSAVADSLCAAAGTKPALSQTLSVYSGCTYSWSASTWGSDTSTCSASDTQTRSVTCLQSDGQTVDASACSGAGTAPATSQTIANFSTCTFSWSQGGFGACSGGTGTWNYSSWAPTTGCGTNLPQTRTGTCVADANAGTATQTLTCIRGDGVTVDNSNCTDTAPPANEACTATSGFSCGTEGILSQSFNDTSICTYAWSAGAWGNDTNTCSTSDTQTRTISCLQSDGTPVASSFCSGAGTAPIASQTVSNFTSCTYTWNASGFGSCTGGAGTWNYSSWSPAIGCGSGLTQTRTGTCVANANAGTQTQSITCLRSDGATVANTSCTGTAPLTSQSCTATSGASCGSEAALSELFSDFNACTISWSIGDWSAPSSSCSTSATETRSVTCLQSDGTTISDSGCAALGAKPATTQTVSSISGCTYSWSPGTWSASSNTCSSAATQTRTVSCLQSDGSTVDAGLCSTAGTRPATSQTVADFSSCTFSWAQGGFGTCTGGSGTWNYTSWSPATGCGTTTQTRTGACAVLAASGTQSQTISCLRSDGTTVANSNCASSGSSPSPSQSCTPDTDSVCGALGILTQTVALTNGCSDQWTGGAWSTCIGGTATWQYTSWTPAAGSACTTSLAQTRSGTCTPTALSGYQGRIVNCQNQAGQVAPDADCTGTKLPTSQFCTMTSGFSCGTEGALAQTVADLSTCAYSWHVSGFGSCTGGTAAWAYSSWTPTCGIGPTTQTRTGSCNATALSGHATQTVTCVRTDNTVVANSFCTGTAPATSQTCTPTTGLSCGVEAALSQKVTLTNKCQAAPVCVPSSTNTCATT